MKNLPETRQPQNISQPIDEERDSTLKGDSRSKISNSNVMNSADRQEDSYDKPNE